MFIDPTKGEVWLIDFSPQVGDELRDPHPAIVISSPTVQSVQLKIVVPIRTASLALTRPRPWLIRLEPTLSNGLTKVCHADAFQIKSVSLRRFRRKMGNIEANTLVEVLDAVALCLDI